MVQCTTSVIVHYTNTNNNICVTLKYMEKRKGQQSWSTITVFKFSRYVSEGQMGDYLLTFLIEDFWVAGA